MQLKQFGLVLATLVGLGVAVLGIEIAIAGMNKPAPYTNPAINPTSYGTAGPSLRYVVIGDSTAAGQGAPYNDGIAAGSGHHLGERNKVEEYNFAVSGAVSDDVVKGQLAKAAALHPDVVLVSVGANDVVGLTSPTVVNENLMKIGRELVAANCNVKIIMTASPNLGTSIRFAQPLRWIAGLETRWVNNVIIPSITNANYTLAPIAQNTTVPFEQDHSLFASDHFHPNARGYGVWLSTINPALDEALAQQPSHCQK